MGECEGRGRREEGAGNISDLRSPNQREARSPSSPALPFSPLNCYLGPTDSDSDRLRCLNFLPFPLIAPPPSVVCEMTEHSIRRNSWSCGPSHLFEYTTVEKCCKDLQECFARLPDQSAAV